MRIKTKLKKTLIHSLTTPPLSDIASRIFGCGVPIFILHRFESDSCAGTSPSHLRHCLQYFSENGHTFISLEKLITSLKNNEPLPPKSVVFTIDDGFADQVEVAAPIFLAFNCPVTIFLITGMLDGELWPWDDKVSYLINSTRKQSINFSLANELIKLQLNTQSTKRSATRIIRNAIKMQSSESVHDALNQLEKVTDISLPRNPPNGFQPITWDMAREYESKGIIFAPHTVSHRILSNLDAGTAESEIVTSWHRIKAELKSPSPVFSYPTGRYCDYGAREIDMIKKAGLIGAVSTYPAQVEITKQPNKYLYQLPRLAFPASLEELAHDSSWLGYARKRPDPMIYG